MRVDLNRLYLSSSSFTFFAMGVVGGRLANIYWCVEGTSGAKKIVLRSLCSVSFVMLFGELVYVFAVMVKTYPIMQII